MGRVLRVLNFGDCLVPYQTSLKVQQQLVDAIRRTGDADILLQLQVIVLQAPTCLTCVAVRSSEPELLQHPPVITLGKRGSSKDLKSSASQLESLGIDVVPIPRGGEATLHSPGQLVLYPILNLHRLRLGARRYIEGLEDVVIKLCGTHGISAQVLPLIGGKRLMLGSAACPWLCSCDARMVQLILSSAGSPKVPHRGLDRGPKNSCHWCSYIWRLYLPRGCHECQQRFITVQPHHTLWRHRSRRNFFVTAIQAASPNA